MKEIIIQHSIDSNNMAIDVIWFLFYIYMEIIEDETCPYLFCVVYFHHLEGMQQCSFAQMGIQS